MLVAPEFHIILLRTNSNDFIPICGRVYEDDCDYNETTERGREEMEVEEKDWMEPPITHKKEILLNKDGPKVLTNKIGDSSSPILKVEGGNLKFSYFDIKGDDVEKVEVVRSLSASGGSTEVVSNPNHPRNRTSKNIHIIINQQQQKILIHNFLFVYFYRSFTNTDTTTTFTTTTTFNTAITTAIRINSTIREKTVGTKDRQRGSNKSHNIPGRKLQTNHGNVQMDQQGPVHPQGPLNQGTDISQVHPKQRANTRPSHLRWVSGVHLWGCPWILQRPPAIHRPFIH